MEMNMEDNAAVSRFSGLKNKYVIFLAACIVLSVFGAAYVVCGLQYANARKEMLAAQEATLTSWVSGTVEAANLWARSLETESKRVSSSELYRMFAEDVEKLGAQAAATINSSDVRDLEMSEDLTGLVEQVPLMRNLLLDFMNLSGLTDARIANIRGQTLLSAMSQPAPVNAGQRLTIERAMSEGKFVFGPVYGAPAGLVIDYADPVRAVADDSAEGGIPVAALLLNRAITSQIAQFLARDRQDDKLQPRLVQKVKDVVEEIQVQSSKPIALDAQRLPLNAAGEMLFDRRPALTGDDMVYSLALPAPDLHWHVVLEMPASIMDDKLRAQGLMIYGIGALISLGVVLAIALLWWVMVGREHRAVAERFEKLYRVIKQQKQLLDSMNVSLEVGLLMVDMDGQVQVCNRAFSEIVLKEETELPGMNLHVLFGNQSCLSMLEGIRRVVANNAADTIEITHPGADGDRLFRVTLYPFVDMDGQEATSGAVATFQDITEFRRNSERRRLQHINTISALVRAIESVDPYLTGHSQRMTGLADLLGKKMGLDARDCDTIRTAASLSQMGKLFVPRDLLTKSGQLTPDEQAEIMLAPQHAYDVLRDIDFGLPVAQAVYEMNERMDGKGYPQHLSGEAISMHARVLSVVNAFCAMVSPRSYRSGMPVNTALDRLRTDSSFDQQVVDALGLILRTPEGLSIATPMQDEAKA